MNIVVVHYPPYCFNWNPIGHRLFCHVQRSWEGAVLQNIQVVKELAAMTYTKIGLGVKININDRAYKTKRQVNPTFKNDIRSFVHFDPILHQYNHMLFAENWNYVFNN